MQIDKIDEYLNLYWACRKNTVKLLEEANILLKNNAFSRAYFLAYTAFEELGKSQIVADYINRDLTEIQYNKAFKEHKFKCAYNFRYIALKIDSKSLEITSSITYDKNSNITNKLVHKRMKSLYVDFKDNKLLVDPSESITPEDTRDIISIVEQLISEIEFAEELNERIGSKALFK